jgi:membrane protein implicated in regulation of membrane protease activity
VFHREADAGVFVVVLLALAALFCAVRLALWAVRFTFTVLLPVLAASALMTLGATYRLAGRLRRRGVPGRVRRSRAGTALLGAIRP